MDDLPEDVKRRIAENRAKALAIRRQKEAERLRQLQQASGNNTVTEQLTASLAQPTFPKSSVNLNQSSKQDPIVAHRVQQTFFNVTNAANRNPQANAGNSKGSYGRSGTSARYGYNKNHESYPYVFSRAQKALPVNQIQKASNVTGFCILTSEKEFRLQCGYHVKLNELLKSYPEGRFDASTRHYCFPVISMEALLKKAKEVAPEVSITPLPSFIPKVLRSNTRIPAEKLNMLPIDPKLRKALMPFQKEGVLRGISQHGRILIADDMGLGKTLQAMAIATYFRSEWPLLVICPTSMRFAWRDAFLQWLPSLTEIDVLVLVKVTDPVGANQIIITSYELLSRRSMDLIHQKFKVVIFDESHFLKSHKSLRTKAALELAATATRIILLSGTPALSRPIELFSQIQCLAIKNWPLVHDYALRYCNARETRFGWDYSGSSHLDELNILLESLVMIRRLKQNVLGQLPAKQRSVIFLDPTLVQKQDKQSEYLSQQVNNDSLSSSERRGILMQYFAKTSEFKCKAVCKYIEELLEADCKFLVFAHHKIMLDAIGCLLTKNKTKFIRIDGQVTSEARQKLVKEFQTKASCRVALLSITAANSGLTLHAANLVIFAELFWNPGVLMQAEDRVHRIGQSENCVANYLVARDTADDYIWPLIEHKLSVLKGIGLSKDTFSDAMKRVSEQVAEDSDESGNDAKSVAGPPKKRQKSMLDFVSASEDPFWADITQDENLVEE